jgi:hypothetical protein
MSDDTEHCGRSMRIQDAAEKLHIGLIFSQLTAAQRNIWITAAVMGLNESAAELWNPSESHDDAQAVVDHLVAAGKGRDLVKALRLCMHLFCSRTYYKNEDTDTFSIAQAVDILTAPPDLLCLSCLYTIAPDRQARYNIIHSFPPAAELYDGPLVGPKTTQA